MGIEVVKMYRAKCDGCGALYGEGHEIVAWDDPGYAREVAEYDGWIDYEGKDYCPACSEWNEDETEIIPKRRNDES